MNYIDIIIVCVLMVFGYGGWKRGIITAMTTLVGLGLGLYAAFHFSASTSEWLVKWIEINPDYLNIVSFIVTFMVVAILVNILGRIVSKMVKDLDLGFIDKIGGFLFGLAKGVLLCSLLFLLLNYGHIKGLVSEKDKSRSKLYPWVEMTVPYIYQGFDFVKQAVSGDDDADEEETPDGNEAEEAEETPEAIII